MRELSFRANLLVEQQGEKPVDKGASHKLTGASDLVKALAEKDKSDVSEHTAVETSGEEEEYTLQIKLIEDRLRL